MKRTAIAAALAAAAIAGPAAANATPSQDSQFLYLLTRAGMTYGSADAAIYQGRTVCTLLDEGYTVSAVESAAETAFRTDSDHALDVMAAAIVSYCPWNDPKPTTPTSNV